MSNGRPKVFKPQAHYRGRVRFHRDWAVGSKHLNYKPRPKEEPNLFKTPEDVVAHLGGPDAKWKIRCIEVSLEWSALNRAADIDADSCQTIQLSENKTIVGTMPEWIAAKAGVLKTSRAKMIVYVVHTRPVPGTPLQFCIHVRVRQSMEDLLNQATVEAIMLA